MSNQPTFTPGPWQLDYSYLSDHPGDVEYSVVAGNGLRVISDLVENPVANGRLIAAAPKLYDALKGIATLVCNVRDLYSSETADWLTRSDSFKQAIAALAEVDGGAN